MTKREMFDTLIDLMQYVSETGNGTLIVGSENIPEIVEKLTAEKTRLETRANTPRKPTERQKENETFKAAILAALVDSEPVTIGGLVDRCPALKGLSNQRITHMITALRGEGLVQREYRKKVAYFSLGTETDTADEVEG